MSNLTDIDRLIEEGLTLYGQGDLDSALQAWERALVMDPENPQATSYVDYVRQNYDLLTNEASAVHDDRGVPFGIAEDEPEYQIEILPGEELGAASDPQPPEYMDPLDAGWVIEDEPRLAPRTRSVDQPGITVELEADEPPEPQPAIVPIVPISFDDETREYPGGPPARKRANDLPLFGDVPDPVTTEFHPEGTPGFGTPADYQTPPGGFTQVTPNFETPTSGFGTQVTDIRQRNTGFVQPTQSEEAGDVSADLGLGAAGAGPRAKRPSQIPSELKMTLRTPGEPLGMTETAEIPLDTPPPATAMIELSYDDPPTTERPVLDAAAVDLINSLPSPTPVQSPLVKPSSTRDLPPPTRAPAAATAELKASASTRDFPPQKTDKLPANVRFAVSDIPSEEPTRDLPTGKLQSIARDLVHAPTRDLGLRPPGTLPMPPPPTSMEEEPTTLRKPRRLAGDDGTSSDIILPFDPIDARSAQILDDVDVGAPAQEAKDERTRRRITKLFELAIEANKAGEVDKAVASIDLALSEDPNSALAQKLLHRNRDTMLVVFQSFLGDLERQPVLARPLHELATAPISPRAAFLLSRVDGTLSLDEVLDVSGMPRLEALRYLCQLVLRGILR